MSALVRAILMAVIAPAVVAMRPAPVATVDRLDSQTESAMFEQTLECLAMNVYHEARSEPVKGQVAVASVTLNRVKSGKFPGSVCEVVKQGTRRSCQFSWWCDGKKDAPSDEEAWENARRIALRALMGLAEDPTKGALYYHATHVKPSWSRALERTTRIGQHLFYKPSGSDEVRLASAD